MVKFQTVPSLGLAFNGPEASPLLHRLIGQERGIYGKALATKLRSRGSDPSTVAALKLGLLTLAFF